MEAHITDLSTWQWCQRKWWFTSRYALNLEPIRPQAALFLGSGVHYALEKCYQPGDVDYDALEPAFSNWFDEGAKERGFVLGQDTDMDKLRTLGLGMVRHYAKWAPRQDGFDVIATEQEFAVRMPGIIAPFAGRFDGVIRSHSPGRLWLHEFKTSSYNLVDSGQQRAVQARQPGDGIPVGSRADLQRASRRHTVHLAPQEGAIQPQAVEKWWP